MSTPTPRTVGNSYPTGPAIYFSEWNGGGGPMKNKTEEERRAMTAKSVATRKANRDASNAAMQRAHIHADTLRDQIKRLELRLESLQRAEALNTVSAALTGKTLLRADEIVKAALPWESQSGVYFLIRGGEVVYVGQSVNVHARISQHKDKKFDRYAFVPCDADSLDVLESLYIHCLRPGLNGCNHNGAKFVPIPLDDLVSLASSGFRVSLRRA